MRPRAASQRSSALKRPQGSILRRVVYVSFLHDVLGARQRRNVERLRLPRTVGDGAVAEVRDEAAVARVPRAVPHPDLGTEAEILFPVHELHGVGVRPLRPEPHDDRVHGRVGHGVHCDQLRIDVELEVVVRDDVARHLFAVRIDFDHRYARRRGRFARRPGRDLGAFVVEIVRLRPIPERRLRWDRHDGAVGGTDRPHGTDAVIRRAPVKILDNRLRASLRDVPHDRGCGRGGLRRDRRLRVSGASRDRRRYHRCHPSESPQPQHRSCHGQPPRAALLRHRSRTRSGPLLAVDAITTWEQVAQQPATDHPR